MNLAQLFLNIYSYGFQAGFAKKKPHLVCRHPLQLDQFQKMAKEFGLRGLEIPIDTYFPDLNKKSILQFYEQLRMDGLELLIGLETFNIKNSITACEIVKRIGGSYFRIKMSNFFGGNRYKVPEFKSVFAQFKTDLKNILPTLEKYGVAVAIENHQDLSATELVNISEQISSRFIKLTWDVGNSLATTDSPLSYVEKSANIISHVHLKDYKIYLREEGIRLVRCAIGSGAVEFKPCLSKLLSINPNVTMSIELGAHLNRSPDIFKHEFWDAYPARSAGQISSYFGYVSNHCERECQGWETPFELDKNEADIIAYENRQFKESMENLKNLKL